MYLGIIIPILIIALAVYFIGRRGLQMKLLANRGIPATAVVVKKISTPGAQGSSATRALRYSFRAADGQEYENKVHVSHEVWNQHGEGDPIEIVYIADKPSVNGARYMVNLVREALKLPPL